jgi:Tfp pilus assembly protein PilF
MTSTDTLCTRGPSRTALLALTALIAACAAPPAPPPAPTGGLAELMERPAERLLFEGIRAYDDGQYTQAETALRRALASGLRSGRDQASAHKLLAFITCTSERQAECEEAFRAARAADPAFALSRSEAGHPLWGPVYRKALP